MTVPDEINPTTILEEEYVPTTTHFETVEFHNFKEACKSGDLESAKTYTSPINLDFSIGLMAGIVYDHLEIVKWCYSQIETASNLLERCFISACIYGHLEIVKWCISLNTPLDINKGIYYSCQGIYSQLEIMKYLKSQFPNVEKCCEDHSGLFTTES